MCRYRGTACSGRRLGLVDLGDCGGWFRKDSANVIVNNCLSNSSEKKFPLLLAFAIGVLLTKKRRGGFCDFRFDALLVIGAQSVPVFVNPLPLVFFGQRGGGSFDSARKRNDSRCRRSGLCAYCCLVISWQRKMLGDRAVEKPCRIFFDSLIASRRKPIDERNFLLDFIAVETCNNPPGRSRAQSAVDQGLNQRRGFGEAGCGLSSSGKNDAPLPSSFLHEALFTGCCLDVADGFKL